MSSCSATGPGAGFISSTANYFDCQVETFSTGAWTALAAPGSTLTVLLTSFLTILIAIIGYNVLFGSTLTLRGTVITFVKIGAVFALATSWPAYRTVVYELASEGPAQLLSEIGGPAGIAGSDGTLLQRLDLVDQAMTELSIVGAGYAPPKTVAPPPFAGFEAFALGGSRIVFMFSALASIIAVRLVIGLMLALGPFFIAFLLFDGTRSLFEGWVRVLGGAAIASLGTAVVLGLQVAFVGPWLAAVLVRRAGGEALPEVPVELFVMTGLFSVVLLASAFACMKLAGAFRLRTPLRLDSEFGHKASAAANVDVFPTARNHGEQVPTERSRAAALASIYGAVSRRDSQAVALADRAQAVGRLTHGARARSDEIQRSVPLGRSFASRRPNRVSAGHSRRDNRL